MNLQEAKIYVGTRSKYNNGQLEGKWVDLSDFNSLEDFLDECKEIHEDEEDPEFMFQDWENIPDSLVNESSLNENFFYLRDEISKLDKDKEEAFWVWLDYARQTTDFGDPYKLIEDFNDSYIGENIIVRKILQRAYWTTTIFLILQERILMLRNL